MKPPSTEWQEQLAPDESDQLQRFATQLVEVQQKMSQKYGRGRALHRKPIVALRGALEVLGELPAHARHGLFATPKTYDVRLRLSNGSLMPQRDRTPDVRGFSIKVLGVDGESALGSGRTTEQDFLLINRETFGFKDATPFLDVVLHAARGPLALVGHMVKTLGLFQGLAELRRLMQSFGQPFSGFLSERFFSSVPFACGPYAVRMRLVPTGDPRKPRPSARFADDLQQQLASAGATFEVQLQFFVDEARTPIEDGRVNWREADAPFVTVARLAIPAQAWTDEEGKRFAAAVEADKFDPWNALVAHRPLGHIMRARRVAYFASQQARAS